MVSLLVFIGNVSDFNATGCTVRAWYALLLFINFVSSTIIIMPSLLLLCLPFDDVAQMAFR